MSSGFTYHPAQDPNHCVFRCLCLLSVEDQFSMNLDSLMIVDFYYLFPSLISDIRMTNDLRREFRLIASSMLKEPYQKLPSKRRLFRQISDIQRATYQHLAAQRIVKVESFRDGIVEREMYVLSKEMEVIIKDEKVIKGELISFLVKSLGKMDLYGINGLKARSGLLEYRYDPI